MSRECVGHSPRGNPGYVLENVEHCGGEPEQADTGCLLANRNGCQEKASMSSV